MGSELREKNKEITMLRSKVEETDKLMEIFEANYNAVQEKCNLYIETYNKMETTGKFMIDSMIQIVLRPLLVELVQKSLEDLRKRQQEQSGMFLCHTTELQRNAYSEALMKQQQALEKERQTSKEAKSEIVTLQQQVKNLLADAEAIRVQMEHVSVAIFFKRWFSEQLCAATKAKPDAM